LLEFPSDPSAQRALKLILIGTLAIGALASLAKIHPVPGFPFWLIAPTWTLNYILMAIAAWLAWQRGGWRTWAMTLYAGQLVLSLFWRTYSQIGTGLILTALLILLMFTTLVALFRRNAAAALAFLPCLAWIVFLAWSGLGQGHVH
jgi:tryptophan-rich sensory protein